MPSYKKDKATGKYVRTDRQGPGPKEHGGQPRGRTSPAEDMKTATEQRRFGQRINAIAARGTKAEAAKLDAFYGDTTPGPTPRRRYGNPATTAESGRDD